MNTTWTQEELALLGQTDELTLTIDGKPVIIWMVTLDGKLFVRSVYGRNSHWFLRTLKHSRGEISVGSLRRLVGWIEPSPDVHPAIDTAFRRKYRNYTNNIVDSTVTERAQSATLQLLP